MNFFVTVVTLELIRIVLPGRMSLPEELALLRLHEAKQREPNSNPTVGVHEDLAERRRAVRDAKQVIGRYGAEERLAWDHAEPIRITCDEEALKVRFESREQDVKQQEKIRAIRERVMRCVPPSGLGVSLSDGARHSDALQGLWCAKQGSVVLRLVSDAKRNVDGDHGVSREIMYQSKIQKRPEAPPQTAGASTRGASIPAGGFGSAKTEYIQAMKKQGKKPDFGAQTGKKQPVLRHEPHPQQARANVDIESQKHLPPYMRKALASMNSLGKSAKGHGNESSAGISGQRKRLAGGGNASSGGGGEDKDGPISMRTYELLGLDPDEELPDELGRIDPRMIEQVCNEVIDSSASVAWEDIAGQEAAKRLIQEVVVWPMMNPEIFKGARAPPKGILLFGPPGTGKTLLGKAIASNIAASFFAISASSLTSKWIGDGEKMVKALFAVAGWMAPSVIFIDEIDSLLSARKSEGEHESSRRLKTEILVQMEGCDPASAERKVLLVGATNRPEELDEAARRRMPKQMYIPLPCQRARQEMIHRVLTRGAIASQLSAEDIRKVVAKTEGYSGSDMKNLIQEACQGPIREAVRQAGAAVATLREQDLRPVVLKDFAVASKAQRASTEPSEIVRYEDYNDKHGAKIVEDGEDGAMDEAVSDGW